MVGVSVASGLSDAATLHRVTDVDGECRAQRVVLPGGEMTWTVLGPDLGVAGPAGEFLEYLRVQGSPPNTVESSARALALRWTCLSLSGLARDALTLPGAGGFLSWLRSGDGPVVVPIAPREPRFSESTVSTRLRAVTSCYRFHELNGVALGGDLTRVAHGGRAVDKPVLDHLARKTGRRRSVLRVRVPRGHGTAGAVSRPDHGDLRRVRPVRPVLRAVGGPGPGPAAVAASRRIRAAAGPGPGPAAPRLAHGPRRHAVHRGRSPRAPARGAGQGDSAAGGCSPPASWTPFTGSARGSCARPAPAWRCRTWTPPRCS